MSDQETSIYEFIGGEQSVRSLSHRFYELMDTLEEAKEIRAMHPKSLEESTEKFFEFLSGWFGGPPVYMKKHGHPRLRMRHFPFAIDKKARDAWMLCMRIALAEHIPQKEIRSQIENAFSNMATHMQNRADK
jgi:hemoglobin